MKRKKIYSMLALGMAMSLVFAVPVSATGASSVTTGTTTTKPTEDGKGTVTITTKPTETLPDNSTKDEETAVTVVDGQITETVVTETITKEDGSKAVTVKTTNELTKAETTKRKDVDKDGKEVVTEITLDKVVAVDESDLSDIMSDIVSDNREADKEELDDKDNSLVRPETLPAGVSSSDLIANALEYFQSIAAGDEAGRKFGFVGDYNDAWGKPGIKAITDPFIHSVAESAMEAMAKKVWGENVTDFKITAAAEIVVPNHDGKTKVNVSIPLDNIEDGMDYFVMHYNNDTHKWERLPATIGKQGMIIAVFDHFSPVYVVSAPKQTPPPETPETPTGNQGSQGDGQGEDNPDDSNNNSNNSANVTKAGTTPAGASTVPANPAVSPKTGE